MDSEEVGNLRLTRDPSSSPNIPEEISDTSYAGTIRFVGPC